MLCSSPRDTVEVASLMESTGRLGVPSLFSSSCLPSPFLFLFLSSSFQIKFTAFARNPVPGYILKVKNLANLLPLFKSFWKYFLGIFELRAAGIFLDRHEGSPPLWLAHEDPDVRDHRCNPGDGMPVRPCEHASCQTG